MSDLVKRLRKGACSKLEAEAADEIERLQKDVENLEGSLKNVRYALIEDMRKWYESFPETCGFSHGLDTYAKDRGIE